MKRRSFIKTVITALTAPFAVSAVSSSVEKKVVKNITIPVLKLEEIKLFPGDVISLGTIYRQSGNLYFCNGRIFEDIDGFKFVSGSSDELIKVTSIASNYPYSEGKSLIENIDKENDNRPSFTCLLDKTFDKPGYNQSYLLVT